MDNDLDRKIDVTAMQFLLVQNRQQTHDWILIGLGANGLGIQECKRMHGPYSLNSLIFLLLLKLNLLNKQYA